MSTRRYVVTLAAGTPETLRPMSAPLIQALLSMEMTKVAPGEAILVSAEETCPQPEAA